MALETLISLFSLGKDIGELSGKIEELDRWKRARSGKMPKNNMVLGAMRTSVIEMRRIVRRTLDDQRQKPWGPLEGNS